MFHALDAAIKTRPFVPFSIRLMNGELFQVTHPENIHLFRGKGAFLTLLDSDGVLRVFNAPRLQGFEMKHDDAPAPGFDGGTNGSGPSGPGPRDGGGSSDPVS